MHGAIAVHWDFKSLLPMEAHWRTKLRCAVGIPGCIEACLGFDMPNSPDLQAVKPRDFAMQINLSMENCWGIVRALVDVCGGLEDGKWLLVKDPNKPLLRLYSVPADAFKVHVHCPL